MAQNKNVKIELWRDFGAISIFICYALLMGLVTLYLFEGVGYFALIPSILFSFWFAWIFYLYLKGRREFYDTK